MFAESDKGRTWISENIIGAYITTSETYAIFDKEHIEDMAKSIEEADLIVEIV